MSKDSMVYIELFFAGGVLLFLYFLMQIFGVFSLNYSFGNSPGLIAVVLIGLTAGISTCMALVGGIVLGISARHADLHPEATPAQKFRPHLFFNAGRILSYVFLGGVIGLIGSTFRFSSSALGSLIIIVGIVMFFLGLKLIEVFPRTDKSLTLPKNISRLFGINRETKEYSHKGDITLINKDLKSVAATIRLSKKTMKTIKLNLFWAFGYNIILIPVAMGALYPFFGLLMNPIFASVAMALSSISVVSNSLLLKRFKIN